MPIAKYPEIANAKRILHQVNKKVDREVRKLIKILTQEPQGEK
jgi:hypothetical protein